MPPKEYSGHWCSFGKSTPHYVTKKFSFVSDLIRNCSTEIAQTTVETSKRHKKLSVSKYFSDIRILISQ